MSTLGLLAEGESWDSVLGAKWPPSLKMLAAAQRGGSALAEYNRMHNEGSRVRLSDLTVDFSA